MGLRTRIAYALRDLSNRFELFCFELADQFDRLPPVYKTENESRGSAAALVGCFEMIKKYPCPDCKGQGYVVVSAGTDVVVCPTCKGFKVDPFDLLLEDNE